MYYGPLDPDHPGSFPDLETALNKALALINARQRLDRAQTDYASYPSPFGAGDLAGTVSSYGDAVRDLNEALEPLRKPREEGS